MKIISNAFLLLALICIVACKSGTGEFKTTAGYKYVVVTKGSGPVAKPEEYVFFTLTVKGDNGKILQESSNPDQLPAMQVPKSLDDVSPPNPVLEVFAKACVGDSVIFYMPIDSLKMGASPEVAGMKHVEYIIGIKRITDKAGYDDYSKKAQEKMMEKSKVVTARFPEVEALAKKTLEDYKAGTLQLKETSGGVKYLIHEEGTGPLGVAGKNASVQYYGMLKSGESFDNSFSRGQAFQFVIDRGDVIKGWDEGLKVLKAGSKATLFIPSELGYGKTGNAGIPGDSELIFYIEVESIK